MKQIKITNKENYLKNRDIVIKEYENLLSEMKTEGYDLEQDVFENFLLVAIFKRIQDQEGTIAFNKKKSNSYIDVKEEKDVLKQMIKSAKAIFKKDYAILYSKINEQKN